MKFREAFLSDFRTLHHGSLRGSSSFWSQLVVQRESVVLPQPLDPLMGSTFPASIARVKSLLNSVLGAVRDCVNRFAEPVSMSLGYRDTPSQRVVPKPLFMSYSNQSSWPFV
ncbi:hypothetical protein CTI12_AA502330 [Artemisia annua]|uniref:Uncharacterized protein n=1 Tax=Artemisia annua TaxID=35608 RepID=A0A2U1LBD0_ARTAN|nr:hypothetical protein CTI12_AA502330 [Artemisia annua]